MIDPLSLRGVVANALLPTKLWSEGEGGRAEVAVDDAELDPELSNAACDRLLYRYGESFWQGPNVLGRSRGWVQGRESDKTPIEDQERVLSQCTQRIILLSFDTAYFPLCTALPQRVFVRPGGMVLTR